MIVGKPLGPSPGFTPVVGSLNKMQSNSLTIVFEEPFFPPCLCSLSLPCEPIFPRAYRYCLSEVQGQA
jgi:hypothetical protein